MSVLSFIHKRVFAPFTFSAHVVFFSAIERAAPRAGVTLELVVGCSRRSRPLCVAQNSPETLFLSASNCSTSSLRESLYST